MKSKDVCKVLHEFEFTNLYKKLNDEVGLITLDRHVEMARSDISNIPVLRKEINEVLKQLKDDPSNCNAKHKLKVKVIKLKWLATTLENMGTEGAILFDMYFNGLKKCELEKKYKISSKEYYRMNTPCFKNELWKTIAVLLYGVDALEVTYK